MKFLLAISYMLATTVSALPNIQESCEDAANHCAGWFNGGCNDQIWGDYSKCVDSACGGVNDVVKDAARRKGC
jgi:hypothetical protein